MYLYQLAWELEQEPPALADRAAALGLGSLDPSDELTAEQESTLRASLGHTGAGPIPSSPGPSTTFTSPVAAQAAPEPQGPSRSDGRMKKVAVIAGATLAFVGAVAFFASQASPAEERREERNSELAAWQDAPPATVAPEVAVAASKSPDLPVDTKGLCLALSKVVAQEATLPDIKPGQKDFSRLRNWTTDREVWRNAIAEARTAGPPNAVPDLDSYKKTWEYYFQELYEASDSDLRSIAEGIELHGLKTFSDDITEARDEYQAHVVQFCPGL